MKRMLTLTAITLTAATIAAGATTLAATSALASGADPAAEQDLTRSPVEERAVVITAMAATGGYSPVVLTQNDGKQITYPIYFRKNGAAPTDEARRAINAAAEEIEMGGLQQITVSAAGLDASERAPRELTRKRLFSVVGELEKAGVPTRWIGVVQPGPRSTAPGV